jgi:hypothetical protein
MECRTLTPPIAAIDIARFLAAMYSSEEKWVSSA